MVDLGDLEFTPGIAFQSQVWSRFSSSVHFSPSVGTEFWLVVSFGRCAIKLSESSVGVLLQAAIGGSATGFRVLLLRDRVFRFSVNSKQLGFFVYGLRKIVNRHFVLFFHLWGNGGPNWKREFMAWQQEQSDEWMRISNKKNKEVSTVQASTVFNRIKGDLHAGQHAQPATSVFKRLSYPADYHLNYLHHSSSTSVFKRLNFPDNYQENYRDVLMRNSSLGKTQHSGQVPKSKEPLMETINGFGKHQGIRHGGPLDPNDRRCFRCLSVGHRARNCRNPICCRVCRRFGHIERFCRLKKRQVKIFRPVSMESNQKEGSHANEKSKMASLNPGTPRSVDSSSQENWQLAILPTSSRTAPSEAVMANFEVDPRGHIPVGFDPEAAQIGDQLREPVRLRAFLPQVQRSHENVAIAVLVPPVAMVDFGIFSRELKYYLTHEHRVRVDGITPSALGAATVIFGSVAERETMIAKGSRPFPPYYIHFLRHDEGPNARACPMDQECWILLLGYPLDCLNLCHLAKVVSGFGLLTHWHESSNLGRVLLQVRLHDARFVPDDVTVTIGEGKDANSITVVVVRLRSRNMLSPPDEDELPPYGPAPTPSRWMGRGGVYPGEGASRASSGSGNSYGSNGDDHAPLHPVFGQNQNPDAAPAALIPPRPATPVATPMPVEILSATAVNTALTLGLPTQTAVLDDPAVQAVVVREEPAAFGRQTCTIEEIVEDRVEQAPAVVNELVAQPLAVENGVISQSPTREETEIAPARPTKTPRRRGPRRVPPPLDVTGLRRSKRLNPNLNGYRDSASANDLGSQVMGGKHDGAASSSSVPPNMSLANIQALGIGFCKMHPTDVSEERLNKSDSDEE
ncbi:hypothetical protein ACP70R_015409 [Stipagrostis hirtigluma subsp. patula]